tara:strand:- start:17 stop:286 length:270 start_codon:yes stop_codon:yes gene_type:complete
MIDIWIETMHPLDHVIAIWDVRSHMDWLNECGIQVNNAKIYDNKILTIELENFEDALVLMKVLSNSEHPPYIQLYSSGRLISDNIDSSY